jgi:glycine/serine hydroxymethyltransferase
VSDLSDKIRTLVEKIEKNNIWRQKECINLIPSETTPSPLVKLCEISDPSGRYAEHRTMKGEEVYFYQGIDFIYEVEETLRKEMSKYFDCPRVELRPISGQMANEIVFKAVTKFINRDRKENVPFRRLSLVMNNELTLGGHLSSQPMGALFNYVEENPATGKENVVNFPVRKDCLYKTDTDALKKLLDTHKPELVVFGKSMFLHREPVEFLYNIVKEWDLRPVIMYDMAHVLGLYGVLQEPFKEGADIVTGSTHKTFFGPQRGVIASSITKDSPFSKLWLDIKSRAFPGSTSNHHLGTLLALLMAAYEMNAFKKEYQTQVRKNARAFAKALKDRGIDVEGDPADNYTETHQVVIRISKHGKGMDLARRLEENNIVTNYQALPDDKTFLDASGIRMGVQEMTRFGMKEKDFEGLAELIADCLIRNANVKDKSKELRGKFLEMHYCLPLDEATLFAAKILVSVFPKKEFFTKFVDNLQEIAKKLEGTSRLSLDKFGICSLRFCLGQAKKKYLPFELVDADDVHIYDVITTTHIPYSVHGRTSLVDFSMRQPKSMADLLEE